MSKTPYEIWQDELRAGPDQIRREQRKQRILGVLFFLSVAAVCAMLWVMG